jgi:hypothetical protein
MKKRGENLKKWKKKEWVKLKLQLNSQPTQYWKNKFNKDNFNEKTCGGNTVAKQKPCKGNTVVIHSIFFFKATKLISQPAQYIKKTDKSYLKKRESILGKRNEKKTVQKRKQKRKKNHVGKATVF